MQWETDVLPTEEIDGTASRNYLVYHMRSIYLMRTAEKAVHSGKEYLHDGTNRRLNK
jgi:hypothetical protein